MIRAVLDTNVWVSGFGWPGSVPGQIVDLALDGRFLAVASEALLDELERVLRYPKLAEVIPDPDRGLARIRQVCLLVEPIERFEVVLEDPDDDRLLEAAVAGDVHYLVTGNRHVLDLDPFEGVRIVRPRAILEELEI